MCEHAKSVQPRLITINYVNIITVVITAAGHRVLCVTLTATLIASHGPVRNTLSCRHRATIWFKRRRWRRVSLERPVGVEMVDEWKCEKIEVRRSRWWMMKVFTCSNRTIANYVRIYMEPTNDTGTTGERWPSNRHHCASKCGLKFRWQLLIDWLNYWCNKIAELFML